MHEYHKAIDWLEKAKKEAEEKKMEKVSTIKVIIGEASGYSAEVIKNYFDEAAKGTSCENAEFDVTVTRSKLVCPYCGCVFEKQLLNYKCPECGTEGNPTQSGNEVEYVGIA